VCVCVCVQWIVYSDAMLYSTGRYLLSGNQNGTVSVWDLTAAPITQLNSDPILPSTSTFLAHDKDTVNGLRYVASSFFLFLCAVKIASLMYYFSVLKQSVTGLLQKIVKIVNGTTNQKDIAS